MKTFLSSICILAISIATAIAQFTDRNTKPTYIPFVFDQQVGFVDTLGNEWGTLGTYNYLYSYDNLSYYVVREKKEDQFHFLNAKTGEIMDLGTIIQHYPIFKMYGVDYFHVHNKGKSVIVSPNSVTSFQLNDTYTNLDRITLYDSSEQLSNNIIIATKENGNKDIFMIEGNAIAKYKHIPSSHNVEVLFKDSYPVYLPSGIAVKAKIIPKKVKSSDTSAPVKKYSKPPIPKEVEGYKIYDYNLNHIGGVIDINDKELRALFQHKDVTINYAVKVKMPSDDFSPATIFENKNEVIANNEYRFIKENGNQYMLGSYNYYPDPKNNAKGEVHFGHIISLSKINFRWKYFNEHQIGQFYSIDANKGFKAYLDFSGNYLPKNRLMLPMKYFKQIKEKEMIEFMK